MGHLVHDHGAGPFDIGRKPAAVELAALLGLGLARRKAVPVGGRQRLGQEEVEVAGIVLLAHRRGVGHLCGRHEVAPAQFGRIHADLARRRVHQPLEVEQAFRPAGAAIGADRGRVGEHAGDLEVDHRDVVGAGGDLGADEQRDGDAGARRIGADIGEGLHAECQDLAVRVERHRHLVQLVATGGGSGEFLAALGAPLHGPLQHLGGPHHDRLVGLDVGAHAEAAADIAHQHADLVLGHLEDDVGQRVARDRGILAADMDDDAIAFPLGHHGARLHGVHDQPLMDDVDLDGMGGRLERFIGLGGIAEAIEAHGIARGALPDLRRVGLQRILDLADRRQRIVFDLDQLGGVLGLAAALGHDRHHALAQEAHDLMGQRAARRHVGLLAVGIGEHRGQGEVTAAFLFHVGPGEDVDHAGRLAGGLGVDLHDPGMGVRRAHQHHVALPGARQIVGESAGAGQKPIVFDALDVLSLAEHCHHATPGSSGPSGRHSDLTIAVRHSKLLRPFRRWKAGLSTSGRRRSCAAFLRRKYAGPTRPRFRCADSLSSVDERVRLKAYR